jgi:hypothetical protein
MKNPKLYLFMLFFGAILMAGCEYAFVQHAEIDPITPDPDNPISFATQIVPIFTSRCLDCHDTGATAPDLSVANAFSSITSMSLVNISDPTTSKLYDYIQPSTSTHSWRKYTATQAGLVLLWIQEGALDN